MATGAWITFFVAIAVYSAGMALHPGTDDTAELQNLAVTMERLHAPGYPLQLLLARVASAVVPVEDFLLLNLLSVLESAAALGLLHSAVSRALKSRWAGAMAATTLGFSHTFWMHGSMAEVYPLNMLFLCGALRLLAASMERPQHAARHALAAAFLLGVGGGNHLTLPLHAAVFGPVWWFFFRNSRRPGRIVAQVLASMAGLASAYAVMGVRFATLTDDLRIAEFSGGPWAFTLYWMSGGYARQELFAFGAMDVLKRLVVFAGYFAYQFPSPSLVLAAAGAYLVIKRKRAVPLALASLGVAVITVLYALNFDSSDVFVFYMPAYLAVAVLAGVAIETAGMQLRGLLPGDPRLSLIALGAALPLFWYATTPVILELAGIHLSADKGNTYYLFPPKRGSMQSWNDQAVALLLTVNEGAPLLTDWNSYHLFDYHRRRLPAFQGRQGPQIVRLEREGEIHRDNNWASYAMASLLRQPELRIYAPGDIPGLRGDRMVRQVDMGGAFYVELATQPAPGFLSWEQARYLYCLLQRRIEAGAPLPQKRNSIDFVPFHDGAGRKRDINFDDVALGQFLRITGLSFPAQYGQLAPPATTAPLDHPDPPQPLPTPPIGLPARIPLYAR